MSRHATEHKQNLLQDMPIDDKGDALLNKGYVTMGTGPKAGAGPKKKKVKELKKDKPVQSEGHSKIVHSDIRLKLPTSPGTGPKSIEQASSGPRMTGSPLGKAYCAKSAGKSGCIKKVGSDWRVVSNKTGKLWPAKYGSQSKAEGALKAYHS